jgi:hypothetical protein
MTRKTMTIMFAALLLTVGPQFAFASCMSDVAEAHRECLGSGPRDRARMADCNASYRDDVAECARYEQGHGRRDMSQMPMHHEPPPSPHR